MLKTKRVGSIRSYVAIAVLSLFSAQSLAAEVNVYSARKEALIKPILDDFSEQTGIKVNLITGKADALISRMKSEGQFSPADVIVTTDVGRLVRAKKLGVTQANNDDLINSTVPEYLRDEDAHWTALTLRARPIMYSKDRVKPESLSTMAALTDAQWKGRICIRSSSNIYNQSMLAAMMELQGSKETLEWAKGLVANFARSPKGGDRDQIKAVVAGECDIAIANTYYLAGMLNSDDDATRKTAQQVAVFWPDQDTQGAHVNISGVGVAKYAKNIDQAKQLIRFMLSDEAQAWYAETNHEYPIKKGIAWSDTLKNMGEFKAQEVSLSTVGENNAKALMLMDSAGWR
ncbi:Fe(3+) ABC transporter substrate-binding protein [Glaciecola sp. MH2013]|uniref:Fe(3+) ABC transporter substrate-binding protein n=1 Tax=Glaciecola sp. MH2013 TaxID=2785524 RepID=UPI0018A0F6F6|nr:Fe(3+) ABC transporter substrate-binding protein [Glaciecola sp. MH2013]MBF7073240.1 Fe(3+) ABC transporter substrate-binding protein [Glaciecola sp. MH2013]